MNTAQFTKNGKYLMLALDHRGSFKKFINKEHPEQVHEGEVTAVKQMIIDSVRHLFSGVLLDPEWGLPAYDAPDRPYLLSLERTGYVETEQHERDTVLQYSVEELVDWGTSGAKLLVYFNPEAKNCAHQLEVSKKALEDCQKNRLPFFLEIVTYGNEAQGKSRAEWVLRSIKMFVEAGIIPDVWKLEYPGDARSCKEITNLVESTPWILLTRGETYEVFKEQLRIALGNGAVGFLAGRAIWQEIADCHTDKERIEFLSNVAAKRFEEICEAALHLSS